MFSQNIVNRKPHILFCSICFGVVFCVRVCGVFWNYYFFFWVGGEGGVGFVFVFDSQKVMERKGNVLFNDTLKREETRCRHMGYSFRLTAKVLLYAPSNRQDDTYHSLCYTSRGALAGREIAQWVHPMKDRSDDSSHHERTLLPRSYISLLQKVVITKRKEETFDLCGVRHIAKDHRDNERRNPLRSFYGLLFPVSICGI